MTNQEREAAVKAFEEWYENLSEDEKIYHEAVWLAALEWKEKQDAEKSRDS